MPIRAPATKPTLTESCAASSTPSASRLSAKTHHDPVADQGANRAADQETGGGAQPAAGAGQDDGVHIDTRIRFGICCLRVP